MVCVVQPGTAAPDGESDRRLRPGLIHTNQESDMFIHFRRTSKSSLQASHIFSHCSSLTVNHYSHSFTALCVSAECSISQFSEVVITISVGTPHVTVCHRPSTLPRSNNHHTKNPIFTSMVLGSNIHLTRSSLSTWRPSPGASIPVRKREDHLPHLTYSFMPLSKEADLETFQAR